MKLAFICDTPYQVLNCINMRCNLFSSNGIECDLYLGHQFYHSQELALYIRREKIFTHVYGYKDMIHPNRTMHYINRMEDILFPRSYINKVLLDDLELQRNEYDCIYISVPTMFAIAFIHLYPKAQLIYYDDGIGSYYDDPVGRMKKSLQGRLCKKVGINLKYMEASALYVNNPRFCKTTMTKNIIELPSLLQSSEEFKKLLYRIFDYSPQEIYQLYSIIYLSQPNDSMNKEVEEQSNKIMGFLQDYYGRCIVRPHPRQSNIDAGLLAVDRSRDLWELMCIEQITEQHVLIGVFSTAQLIPKLLYNKEPYLIFLYRLDYPASSDMNYSAFEQMIEEIKSDYQSPEKVMVPQSWQEFKQELDHIV